MDVYKLRPGETGQRTISKTQFEADTLCKPPWYQFNRQGKKVQFAVCPACDNPIQIIGLYHLPPRVNRPFGRHLATGGEDLAPHDPEARENCPFFKPRPHQKTDRKQRLDGLPLKILQTLMTQFDRVVYLIQKETGLVFSTAMLRKMLDTYRAEKGYLYTGATLTNIPWVFAYMTDSQPLFMQKITSEALRNAVRSHVPAASITDEGRISRGSAPDGRKRFFTLDLCFIKHQMKRDGEDGALTEAMDMVISIENQQVIYRKEIVFNHEYFQNLIQLPDARSSRRPALVDLAREHLGHLCDTR
ncbi:hypothetical protein CKO35_15825 [Ectothiorhodospira shaposhnikovii]|uniref:hypothetical protein n=1 Tax=Ectothiorhodospira shaposhnikovii TaxID=1054 RepID=UPI00190659EE|nr:hypothetical protein [Ectothiorhodospira shaposhnikovii]MBK1674733.1 hypothetical protein [Ectothiorhodospira shaposhnikovii]